MLIKKWDKDLKKYEDIEVPQGCKWFSLDMEEKITCPSCGSKLLVSDGYTSNVYYSPNGVLGMIICQRCHQKEMRGIFKWKR